MTDEKKVIDFPRSEVSEEERVRRVMVEVDRLARLSPGEWKLWLENSAQTLGITPEMLRDLVETKLKDIKAAERAAEAEKRRQEDRAERQRHSMEREEIRKRERQSKEKSKAFADIAKLPSDRRETRLDELTKRLDEDPAALGEEFSEYAKTADETEKPSATWHVEPWPEPVETAALLGDVIGKIDQHFAARPHEVLTVGLWTMMAWVHEVAATYSPFLVATSAEPDSGKTTMLGTVSFLTPKPFSAVEVTGANIYRFVDREKPTFILDEADDLFSRKTDVKHIINSSWTRGTKIPRQATINGVSTTVWYDPFCPKAIGLLGLNMPRTLASRSIIIKAWPKRPEDKQTFDHVDDDVFAELRSKLARWSLDNAVALKDARPLYPPEFNNRLQSNWRLLLAISELAGGQWSERAREAAERISRTTRKPSFGLQLLAALHKMFASRSEITSEEIIVQLRSDPDGVWIDYKGGQITQRQVADLLEQYDITPHAVHPTKRGNLTLRGYSREQFIDVFTRFVPSGDPHIRTSQRKPKSKSSQRKSSQRKKR
jgi:putative DNA primase/helicase